MAGPFGRVIADEVIIVSSLLLFRYYFAILVGSHELHVIGMRADNDILRGRYIEACRINSLPGVGIDVFNRILAGAGLAVGFLIMFPLKVFEKVIGIVQVHDKAVFRHVEFTGRDFAPEFDQLVPLSFILNKINEEGPLCAAIRKVQS